VVSALGLALLVTGFSLPIDDFWLSLASARELANGAPIDRAVDLTWMPTLPDALNPQWGAQVLLGVGGSIGGALVVNALLLCGGLALLAWRSRRDASLVATGLAMVLALAVLAPHLLARAQSFSILLAPLALALLERRPVARWLPVAYGVLIAVWANLHGAFVVGQLAAGAALAGALLPGAAEAVGREARALLAATALAALIAPLLNPAGADLLIYAYAQPGLEVVRSISVEWQPSWPWIPVATLFWVLLALWLIGRVLRRRETPASGLLLGLVLGVLAAGSIRHIPWFVIAVTPTVARDIDAVLHRNPRLALALGQPARWLQGRSLSAILLVGLALVVLFQPVRPRLPDSIGRVTPDAPVALAEQLADELQQGTSSRVLNEQVWGGYLAYRLGDRIETAMDGRLEIRDRATWSRYFALLHGEEDPAEQLAADGVRWAAVAPTRETLIAKLTAAGWTTRYRSSQSVLLRAPAG
jgi:hypothetical protein